jgi:hypothetical protein
MKNIFEYLPCNGKLYVKILKDNESLIIKPDSVGDNYAVDFIEGTNLIPAVIIAVAPEIKNYSVGQKIAISHFAQIEWAKKKVTEKLNEYYAFIGQHEIVAILQDSTLDQIIKN